MGPVRRFLESTRRRSGSALVISAMVAAAVPLGAVGTPAAGASARTGAVTFGALLSGKAGGRGHAAPVPVPGVAGRVVQVTSSNSDGYALTHTGAVWAWGLGARGELGNGTRPAVSHTAVRVDFPPGVRITTLAVPMPYDGGLAIDSSGHAWGWGVDGSHQLCVPHTGPVLRPVQLPLSHVTLITGAGNHALFDAGGTAYACGAGDLGQLGDGSTSPATVPTKVVGLPGGPIASLTSSWKGSGALMADGRYYDWGYGRAGQLGNGTTADSDVPVEVPLPGAAVTVSQGGSGPNNGQTLALLADGSLWAWGNNRWGQLGIGSSEHSSVPVSVSLPKTVAIASINSGGSSCFLVSTSGRLWSWGRDEVGQLGTGRRGAPRKVPRPTRSIVSQVSSTATNVAGLVRS